MIPRGPVALKVITPGRIGRRPLTLILGFDSRIGRNVRSRGPAAYAPVLLLFVKDRHKVQAGFVAFGVHVEVIVVKSNLRRVLRLPLHEYADA